MVITKQMQGSQHRIWLDISSKVGVRKALVIQNVGTFHNPSIGSRRHYSSTDTTTMSFAVSASATRVVASVRVPVKAQRASAAAAFVAPAAKANSAARLSMRSNASGVALKAAKSTVAAKAARGNMAVFAGRFETERTYIMIKPDGVQRGYVSTYPYVEYPYPSVPEPASSSIIDRSIDTPAPIQPSIRVHHDTTLTVSAPSPSLLP